MNMISDNQTNIARLREKFNCHDAPRLAEQVGVVKPWIQPGVSSRFAYFANDDRFVVVAGAQEGDKVAAAFAYGLTYRSGRKLLLVLPEHHALATSQRAPWFSPDARPEIWQHSRTIATRMEAVKQEATIQAFEEPRKGRAPHTELAAASTGLHLGSRSSAVSELVDWATTHRLLDPSHRKGERSWHCMGQKVLSIKRTKTGLSISAGIHWKEPGKCLSVPVNCELGLSSSDLKLLQAEVEQGIELRLCGPFRRPDEHWLQAVIRRNPKLVGVEQPALRELPAWRPQDSGRRWGRGYIDLIGMDGHGDIRVVETKIADNKDEILILQGLDYFIWAQAYDDALRTRLGAATRAKFEINYVVGSNDGNHPKLSPFTNALAAGIDAKIRWRFQIVSNWQDADRQPDKVRSEQLGPKTLPA